MCSSIVQGMPFFLSHALRLEVGAPEVVGDLEEDRDRFFGVSVGVGHSE